jgi:hypothetical protein
MLRVIVIVLALGLYALVIGCGLSLGEAGGPPAGTVGPPPTGPAAGGEGVGRGIGALPLRGVGMQIQRTDWIDRYEQGIDEIAALGADTVKFVVDSRQENGASARIYLDVRMTPTHDQLARLIRHAKSKGLRVILMPIVLLDNPRDDEWRGRIQPLEDNGGWEEWWNSYRGMLNHWSWIAEGNGVDVFVVGSELISTEREEHLAQWRRTIEDVRRVFKGKLTYSSNWDHYTHVKFWDRLDFIGMNSYWALGDDRDVTVEEIVRRWVGIQKELFAFQKKVNKPLLFLEVGWCSMSNMAHEPWNYTRDEVDLDLDLQRRLYEGFFRAWHGRPELGGFSMWEWTPGDGGPEDRGYTPENKPAERVLREWLAKPWN